MSSIRQNKRIIIPNISNPPTPWVYTDFGYSNIVNRSTNVGIGTQTPSFTLEVSGNNVNTINTSLYYEVSGTPINNSFYPSLSPFSALVPPALNTWISVGGGDSNRAVAWSPPLGLFAVASNTANVNSIYTSPNGFNWTAQTTPAYGAWDIIWAPYVNEISSGCFLAISSNGVMRSTNGITWDGSNNIIGNDWVGLTWSQEKQIFVAVARTATVNSSTVMVSSNGFVWTAYTPPINATAICFSKELGLFAAIGTTGGIMISTNGINWSVADSTRSGSNIIWSSELGLFVANVQYPTNFGGNTLNISKDGRTWSTVSTPVDVSSWSALSFSPQLGTFVALSGTTDASGVVAGVYSSDGITWNRCGNFAGMRRMVWSPELGIFVAVVNSGTRIITSSMRGRPPTSFNVFDSSYNNINELGMWTFRSFGRNPPVLCTTTPFTVTPGMNWVDISVSTAAVLTLPSATNYQGMELNLRTLTNRGVTSATANVIQNNNISPATTTIFAATTDASGSFVNLVSGLSGATPVWYIMQKN